MTKTEFEQKVDDIFENLITGHNFDYAGRAIKELAAAFHTQEVERAAQALHKFADQPKVISRKDIHDFANNLVPPPQ